MSPNKTGFIPSLHGFNFVNRFSGLPLPLATLSEAKIYYGFCGGMVAAACDFFRSNRSIPAVNSTPKAQSNLYQYLSKRQLDTYGNWGKTIAKMALWMAFPKSKIHENMIREISNICQKLDQGELVILGLLYVNLPKSFAIWENHQVLAYNYIITPEQNIHIYIYDPNFPGKDDVIIEVQKNTNYWQFTQKIAGIYHAPINGFFVIPYIPIEPPQLDQ